MSVSEQEETRNETRNAEPLLPDDLSAPRHLTLDDLWLECAIDAALIDIYLPHNIRRDSVRLAQQKVADWRNKAGEMRKVTPAVVLWGLLALDQKGAWYSGSLIGVEGGAQIDPVTEGINVLDLVNRAAGGGGIALDDIGFQLWRKAAAPLENGVALAKIFDSSDDEVPKSISAWVNDRLIEDPKFDTTNLYLGKRALPHVATISLYRVQQDDQQVLKMQQVGPVIRSVSASYSALGLGSMEHPWRGQHGVGTKLVFTGARMHRLQAALENPNSDPNYQLPGLMGDTSAVLADAAADYARRHRSDVWRDFLPPPDAPAAIAEAQAFVTFVNSTLRDLHIRTDCAEPEPAGTQRRDLPYTARIRDLPFWDCYQLVEITERLGVRSRRTTLLWEKDPKRLPTSEASQKAHPEGAAHLKQYAPFIGQIIGLDGTAAIINLINHLLALVGRLRINAETTRSYIEFFCATVHSDAGSFSILEQPDDVDWTGFHHKQKELIGPCLFPMRLWPKYGPPGEGHDLFKEGDFVIESTLTYGGGLFRTIFLTSPNGKMTMLADNPIIGELQIRAYSFTQKNNWLLATFQEVK